MASRNYIASYNALHVDGTLAAQCEMFLLVFAVPLINAEPSDAANHAARAAWATAILTDPAKLATATRRVQIQAVQNPTIAATIAAGGTAEDSDIEFVGAQFLPTLVALGA